MSALKALGIDAVYTRYADDLVFSFNEKPAAGKVQTIVRQLVEPIGFSVNVLKTRFQSAANGRVVICGIGVDKSGLHPTRRAVKRLRAATHQGKKVSVDGLQQWSKCKLPKEAISLLSTRNSG